MRPFVRESVQRSLQHGAHHGADHRREQPVLDRRALPLVGEGDYTHLFEDAATRQDIRTRMATSPFAGLLEPTTAASGATVLKLA